MVKDKKRGRRRPWRVTREGLLLIEGASPRGTALEGAWFELAEAHGGVGHLAEAIGISTAQLYRVAVQGSRTSRPVAQQVTEAAKRKGVPCPPMRVRGTDA
jgi:hypothetical protein